MLSTSHPPVPPACYQNNVTIYSKPQHFSVYCTHIQTDQGSGHGNQDGPHVCQLVHGGCGGGSPPQGLLNTGHPTINFTLQYNMHSIDFLDINIYKSPRFQSSGILDLQPHYKLTNTFSYLHFSSSHPPHVQTGLIKGELTRLLRLSSSPSTYAKHVNLLLTHLRERGYPGKLLRAVARRYPYSLRDSKLPSNTTKATLYQDVIRLIYPYHPAFPPPLIRQAMAVRADWPFVSSVAFTKNKTLATLLVSSTIR